MRRIDPQAGAFAAVHARCGGPAFVYWLQDLVGIAIRKILSRKIPVRGQCWSAFITNGDGEARLLRAFRRGRRDHRGFRARCSKWLAACKTSHTHVVENWAAREDLAAAPRDNAWAREQGLVGKTVFLYSGTLGLKHDPSLLRDLAAANPDALVVVNSEGRGADWLKANGASAPNLRVLPFQPFARLGEVLASADILVAVLEPDAGIFSVPSKVLTYLCAGRPLLLAVPPANLAARIVTRAGAGLAADPRDRAAFLGAGSRLAGEPVTRAAMGAKALDYAAKTFDIAAISARFEAILRDAALRGKK